MTEFHSVFRTEMAEYLVLRQAAYAPESYKQALWTLANFDRLLCEQNAREKAVTESAVSEWIRRLNEVNGRITVSNKIGMLRGWLKYLQNCDFAVFMPVYPRITHDYVPYIFSVGELTAMINAADECAAQCRTSAAVFAFPMLLRVLYGCGLRLGEALALTVADVDFGRGVLTVLHAKNSKQRLVPMHRTLTDILRQYTYATDIAHMPSAFLFFGRNAKAPMSQTTVHSKFAALLKSTGIHIPAELHRRGQCPHCLRHTFAVHSFAQSEQNGRSAIEDSPYLSVYLGHFDLDSTEKYLKFGGDMFPAHTALFENYAAGVFSEVCLED